MPFSRTPAQTCGGGCVLHPRQQDSPDFKVQPRRTARRIGDGCATMLPAEVAGGCKGISHLCRTPSLTTSWWFALLLIPWQWNRWTLADLSTKSRRSRTPRAPSTARLTAKFTELSRKNSAVCRCARFSKLLLREGATLRLSCTVSGGY